ncbi:uncharacterized protein LOC108742436 [Agrilus planipennis]|uniref:Uncharacterized protein LOC108742436 n=1 Tax=Agrilus planipennis TaxID=224129 RepID=A0A1W4XL88_AGRPL|nr:uncharacterized protein LOC108742436 [Agrilus planipennis]
MNFELFVVLVLIFVFLLSCGGLIQKVRQSYEERAHIIAVQRVSAARQIHHNQGYYDDSSTGVFPGGLCPPPYTEYNDPPPKYEEIVKESIVVNMPQVLAHSTQINSQNSNNVRV